MCAVCVQPRPRVPVPRGYLAPMPRSGSSCSSSPDGLRHTLLPELHTWPTVSGKTSRSPCVPVGVDTNACLGGARKLNQGADLGGRSDMYGWERRMRRGVLSNVQHGESPWGWLRSLLRNCLRDREPPIGRYHETGGLTKRIFANCALRHRKSTRSVLYGTNRTRFTPNPVL